MAVTQYVGSRYVPLFADPAEWTSTKEYEPLTIVLHEGASYTSKQFVPVGIEITNADFWARTGDYNAQVEQYRREVAGYSGRITETERAVESLDSQVDSEVARLDTKIDSTATTINGRVDNVQNQIDNIDTVIDRELEPVSNFIEQKNYLNSNLATTMAPDGSLVKLGDLELPAGEYTQGMAIHAGYLYVVHHVADGQMLHLSKYRYPDLAKVGTIDITTGLHGNALAVDKINGYLYISSSFDTSFHLVNLSEFKYVKKIAYGGQRNSGIAISPDATKVALNPSDYLQYVVMTNRIGLANWFGGYLTQASTSGYTLRQDMTADAYVIYQLCSNQNSKDYNGQCIHCMMWNGKPYRTIYLPDTTRELEGLDLLDGKFIITDSHGGVFQFTPAPMQIMTDTIMDMIGTYSEPYNTHWIDLSAGTLLPECVEYYVPENRPAQCGIPWFIRLPSKKDPDGSLAREQGPFSIYCNGTQAPGAIGTTGVRMVCTGNIADRTNPFAVEVQFRAFGWGVNGMRVERLGVYDPINGGKAFTRPSTSNYESFCSSIDGFWDNVAERMPLVYNEIITASGIGATGFLVPARLGAGNSPFVWNSLPCYNSTMWSDV